jgi:hypothetical protein
MMPRPFGSHSKNATMSSALRSCRNWFFVHASIGGAIAFAYSGAQQYKLGFVSPEQIVSDAAAQGAESGAAAKKVTRVDPHSF